MAHDEIERSLANPGYALGQLGRALLTSERHDDPAVRERAQAKVETWTRVMEGMLAGALSVGTRTPVKDTPAWATLEVATGGFATGALVASGPLLPHEVQRLERLRRPADDAARAALNASYLTEEGLEELRELVASGRYRVEVPEEGALLVVAWLLEHGEAARAREVLDALVPFFRTLRFYPIPETTPLLPSSLVHVQTVGNTIEDLRAIRTPERVETQRETLHVWNPMLDRMVALFVETLEGPAPTLRRGEDGQPLRADGRFVIEGGWPCQHYPEGWRTRARELVVRYAKRRRSRTRSSKPEREGGSFALLRGYLERCLDDPRSLDGRDVGRIRATLAHIAHKRGLPGSERCESLRAHQARIAALPTKKKLAAVVVERLGTVPREGGLSALEPYLAPMTAEEARRHRVPEAHPVADKLRDKLVRSLDAPVEWLVDEGVIPSGEVLARVIPQITSQVTAAGIEDAELSRLYGGIYAAFRRRRSLLLLDLASQVKLVELPWVAVIESFRARSETARSVARRTLEDVGLLALSAFPQTILPNKLLQELRALSERAGLGLPIVDEVAADIFMGEFTAKYLDAAKRAAAFLSGSLYEAYYEIDAARVQRLEVSESRFGARTSPGFVQLCRERAEESGTERGRSWVAQNGKVIEQEQVLTTHNLAVLVEGLGLSSALAPRVPHVARLCFEWICRQQQIDFRQWKPRLHALKNGAYAWRQMIFFLSLLPASELPGFVAWARGHLAEQRPGFASRFAPAIEGLELAVRGESPGQGGGKLLLGWTTEKHWLLG
jgi:hypothetical protein